MPEYRPESLCNLALVGPSLAGKTTLVEALLNQAGIIHGMGSIEKGTTVCDFDPQEQSLQHSLMSCVVNFDHGERHINLIDTPGIPELLGHALSTYGAVETVACVVDAQTGPTDFTDRLLRHAREHSLCRLLIVNKIDAVTDLQPVLAALRERYGPEVLPLNLPADGGSRVSDCFFNPAGPADFSSIAEAHTQIIDQVVELDEDLMALYLEQGQELQPEQLHAPFEKALREGHLIPVLFTSARTGAGIPELINAIDQLMPSPPEGNPRPFEKGEGPRAQPYRVLPDPDLHVVAHVFKVTSDPYLGKIGVFRVHQGTVRRDSQLFIGDGRRPVRIAHLYKVRGREQMEIQEAIPGEICAVAKVDAIEYNAVLHDSHDEDYIHLRPIRFPAPVYGLAVHPVKHGDEQKVFETLERIAGEDPCLHLVQHYAVNETVLEGLGEFHVQTALTRLKQLFGVEVETSPPRIPYRETIGASAEGHHRHKKQTGGAGQFGEVHLKVEPLARGAGFEFESAVTGGAIPTQFIPAVEKGVRQILESGAIAGHPLQDLRVTVLDGKHHPVDSKEIAFITAGRKAFLAAVRQAEPLILEPLVTVQILAPQDVMGSITGDLAAKRGQILGTEMGNDGIVKVIAEVPLRELQSYQIELKSMTGGRGRFSMEFSRYDVLPRNIQDEIAARFQLKEEEA